MLKFNPKRKKACGADCMSKNMARSYHLEWSYRCILKNYLRAYGRTDRQTRCLKGDHSQKIMQRVEVQSQQKKHAVPIECKKNTAKSI